VFAKRSRFGDSARRDRPRAALLSSSSRWVKSLLAVAVAASFGCGSTTDSLGDSKQPTVVLAPLSPPAKYPNPFRDLLGKSETDINSKVDAAFAQLFHGDPTDQSIYFPTGNYADIWDVLHDDYRTEGYGLAMLIAVELDRREEFDRVWRGAMLRRSTNPSSKGYFKSRCEIDTTTTVECLDPFGLQQIVMALIFANNRWKDRPLTIDYAAAASELLYLLRNTEAVNGGIVDGVTNTFDKKTKLVFDFPTESPIPGVNAQSTTRPSLEIAAYYTLWAQATGDPFYSEAAVAARDYLRLLAHPTTGFTPIRSYFNRVPTPGYDSFQSECYRVQLNLMLDQIWTGNKDGAAASTRLLDFFTALGKDTYPSAFSLDGKTVLNSMHEGALIAANGMSAVISNNTGADRVDYVNAVWELPLSTGKPRYFPGLMHMLSLLALSGKLQVY
jgi:oligosaccharide reducing-end xylanase